MLTSKEIRKLRRLFEEKLGWVCELEDDEICEVFEECEENGDTEEAVVLQAMLELQEDTMI